MSEMWLQLGSASSSPSIPITMDYEGQVSEYLENRYRQGEMPFSHAVLDDYEQPVIAAEVVASKPPRETELPAVGINEFLMPNGMQRFGRGLFLIDKAHIAALVNFCWGINWDGTGQIPNDGVSDRAIDAAAVMIKDDLGNINLFQPVYMLPPIQVDSGDNELYIVPMVDFRWLALHFTLGKDEFDVGSATTWPDLLTSINNATPNWLAFGGNVTFSAEYLQPDPGYFSASRSLAYALDHIAASIGHRITIGNSGQTNIQSWGDALGESAKPDRAMFGTYNANPTIPDSIRVSYRQLFDHADNETWNSVEAGIDDHTGAECHVVTTYYEEWYSETVDPMSQQDLAALVTRITQDIGAWRAGPNYAITIPGGPDDGTSLERCGFTDYTLLKVDCSSAIPQLSLIHI
jgi:hypothetical protein